MIRLIIGAALMLFAHWLEMSREQKKMISTDQLMGFFNQQNGGNHAKEDGKGPEKGSQKKGADRKTGKGLCLWYDAGKNGLETQTEKEKDARK